MSIEVKMNMFAIADALAKNAKATRVTASDVLRLEMGQIAASLAKYTPPAAKFSKRKGGDWKIGKDAIDDDLSKIITGVKDREDLKEYEHIQKYYAGMQVDMSGSSMASWHKRYRASNGRVKYKANDIGKFRSIDMKAKLYVPMAKLKSYSKSIYQHVGKLKAGWVNTIKIFKGKLPPAWITKHPSSGNAIDRLDTNTFTGYLGGVNTTLYAGIINKKGVVPWVVKMHQDTIDAKIKNVVGNAVRRFNALNPPANEVVKVA